MSHLSLYRHVKHVPKSISYGAYCQVYRYDAHHILKVMPSDDDEGVAPGQLRECNFYCRLKQPNPIFLTCDILQLKLHPEKRATTLHLKMPQLTDDMWRLPNKAFATRAAALHALPHLIDHITTALFALHENGVLHRDIKPSNIMYDQKNGRFYLIDFGSIMMSCVKSREPGFCTYIYSAPEAGPDATDSEYHEASDVYSFAATVADIILDYLSFSEDLQDWAKIIKTHDFPPSFKHCKSVLLQAVNPDPKKRCSLNDLRRAFQLPPLAKPEKLFVDVEAPSWSLLNARIPSNLRKMLFHLLANICLTQDWDKFTFVSAVQMFNDFMVLPDCGAKSCQDMQHVALACLSLAEKTLEDRFLDIIQLCGLADSSVKHTTMGTKFVNDMTWTVVPLSLFKWETTIWTALKGILTRRSPAWDYQSVDWSDLLAKVNVQTV
jgi:serine/threonine protein kinase